MTVILRGLGRIRWGLRGNTARLGKNSAGFESNSANLRKNSSAFECNSARFRNESANFSIPRFNFNYINTSLADIDTLLKNINTIN